VYVERPMIRRPVKSGPRRRVPRSRRPVLRPLAVLLILGLGGPGAAGRPAAAHGQQAVPAAYGALSGAAGGVLVTTGIFVAKARAGSYIYSLDDALAPRWEIVPAVAMPVGGFVVGLDDEQRLARSIAWGSAGFAAGALAGYALGELLSETDQGKWAGAIIGSAAGVLAGSLYGMLSYEADGRTSPAPGTDRRRRSPEIPLLRIRL